MTIALLIIDMQVGSFNADSKRHDVPGLIDRLNDLLARVRAAGGSVIFIQHDGPPDDPHHPGTPGWEILPELNRRTDDILVRKTNCDSFLETNLEAVLAENGVDSLIVTGNATDFCVDTTIRSALARRYRTLVPRDGHTTADRPHLKAVEIIRHHHEIWSDFIAPAGPAQLTTCAEVGV